MVLLMENKPSENTRWRWWLVLSTPKLIDSVRGAMHKSLLYISIYISEKGRQNAVVP